VPIDNGSDEDEIEYLDHEPQLLRPPHTPADSCLISSSTGTGNDSIPPTPMDVHGDGDLSVPSPGPGPSGNHNPGLNRRPRRDLDVDDMMDSTVDSSGFSSVNLNQQRSSYNDSNEGPVQSSHYEDSSDDDCDDGHAQASGPSSGFRRQCSNVESGISTSGQVDEGQFRLVPNPIEDEHFNQYNSPRNNRTANLFNETRPNVSSSSAPAYHPRQIRQKLPLVKIILTYFVNQVHLDQDSLNLSLSLNLRT